MLPPEKEREREREGDVDGATEEGTGLVEGGVTLQAPIPAKRELHKGKKGQLEEPRLVKTTPLKENQSTSAERRESYGEIVLRSTGKCHNGVSAWQRKVKLEVAVWVVGGGAERAGAANCLLARCGTGRRTVLYCTVHAV